MKRNPFWGIRQTAEFLGVSTDGLRNIVLRKEIPYLKKNGRIVFDPDKLDRWIGERQLSLFGLDRPVMRFEE